MSFFNTSAPADQRRPKAPGMRTNTEGKARFDRAAANPPRSFRAMPRWLRATGVVMVAVLAFGATSAQAQGGGGVAAGDVTGAAGDGACPTGFVAINNVCVANVLTDIVRPTPDSGICERGFIRIGTVCVASDFTDVPPRDPGPWRYYVVKLVDLVITSLHGSP